MDEDEYITVEAAAAILGVTTRQANRYGSGNPPRVRIQRAGRRILYHRGDVEALADELGAHRRLTPPPPTRADLIPAGEMLDYLRERDAQLEALQAQLRTAAHRIGELEGELAAIQAERDAIRQQLTAAPRPWWRFWTRDKPS